jgi:hypothetical protein
MTTDVKFRPGRPPRPVDYFTLSTNKPDNDTSVALVKKESNIDLNPMSLGLSPEQVAEHDCLTNFRENANISIELRRKICKIINGVMVNTGDNDDTKKKDSLDELMHLWFNDHYVVSEIDDTLRRNGLHIAKQIILLVRPMDKYHRDLIDQQGSNIVFASDDYKLYYGFFTFNAKHSAGNNGFYPLNPAFYKETIDQYLLSEQLFAIPFGFSYMGINHSNMLIIRQYNNDTDTKKIIEAEHFEPHGQFFEPGLDAALNKEQSDFIVNRVFELIQLLFDPAKYKIIVLNPNQICPTVELQGLTSGDFGGSCKIFAWWYMLLRLLNPSRSRSETYHLMNNFLTSSHSANDIIRQIVATFVSLVSVDLTRFTVNGISLSAVTKDKILASKGGRMNPPKPMRKKKKFKTVKKRNKKTIKIINRKRNKTKIKRKCMYSKLG